MHQSPVDFLGIGAQKAGTTWLWSILKSHPDVWMPPKKELHYFDRDRKYPSWSYLSEKHLLNRLTGSETYHKEFRRLLKEDLTSAVRSGSLQQMRWMMRFYFGSYDDPWYLSLFADGENLLKGEITPDYSLIDLEDIQAIKALLPKLKIVLLLRNPIDRAWSQVRFEYTKGRFDQLDESAKIRHILDQPKVSKRSEYVRMVNDWISVFGKESVFVGFYDEIVSNPQNLIQKVCDFLDLDASKLPQKDLSERKNVSVAKNIPVEIEFLLAGKYRHDIQELMNVLNSDYVVKWLGKTESILSRMA
ncbi:sulfotransferase [Nodosilinea sp. AN01ver1]|uniref:sulfotransferase n=1 Tax=Nodosilinea sp. AN01ver1 TaxID=3423362 RepID=UPI003D321B5E